ncbi:MAG TPA: hypothetical protein VFE51_01535 [Verrucomicrobiae bacterium]|nr:hypothetical protein [Verrucomicrobiae bacterium]
MNFSPGREKNLLTNILTCREVAQYPKRDTANHCLAASNDFNKGTLVPPLSGAHQLCVREAIDFLRIYWTLRIHRSSNLNLASDRVIRFA